MQDPATKKLDQIIVILADMAVTFGDRFDKIAAPMTWVTLHVWRNRTTAL